MTLGPEKVALIAFFSEAILAAGNPVGVRFSNRELPPLWGGGLRFVIAAACLLALVAALKLPLPRGRALKGAILFGIFNFGASFALAYYGFVTVHAGLGATLLALVPLGALVLAALHGQERLGLVAVAGSLLAVAGVAVISLAPMEDPPPPLSVLALVGGALCFAEAAVLVRRFPPVHPITMNAVAMATGAALLLAGSLIVREPWTIPEQQETWVAIAYLVIVGSIGVFLLYLLVLKHWDASRAAYGFVITPVVTVFLSSWLDQEPITVRLLLGGLLVLAGVYIGALRPARPVVT
ncbi:MAG: EamA family transporter [Actinomycetota bacterium]|nr:EamA family transporter [Actinomycetota bacterium]